MRLDLTKNLLKNIGLHYKLELLEKKKSNKLILLLKNSTKPAIINY